MATMSHTNFKCSIIKGLMDTMSYYMITFCGHEDKKECPTKQFQPYTIEKLLKVAMSLIR